LIGLADIKVGTRQEADFTAEGGSTRPLIYERGQAKMDYEKMWNELQDILKSHKNLSNKKNLNLMSKINRQHSVECIKDLLKPLRKLG